jgi:drug/metabolite transporter (DMT)-like permease
MSDAHGTRAHNLGILSLAVIAPIWGYSWVVIKVALDYASPFTYVALITAVCAVGFLLTLRVAGRSLRPPPLRWTVSIGLLQTSLFNILATVALDAGGAGKVSVLAYTMPFWLLLLAWLFLGERLRGLQWPAVALAFLGLVLVVRPWDIGGALSGVLACSAGFVWAAGGLLIKLLQRRSDVDALSLTTWQMALGAVPLVAIAVVTRSGWPEWTGAFIACAGYTVFLSSGLCWFLWIFALRALPAGAAGMGTLAVPVIGVMASWVQLGERPLAPEAVGMALIIAGLAALASYGLLAARRGRLRALEEPAVIPPVID